MSGSRGLGGSSHPSTWTATISSGRLHCPESAASPTMRSGVICMTMDASAGAAPESEAVLDQPEHEATPSVGSALEVLGVATRLGLTSFGGPVAHLGYFRDEYVDRRRWLDDQTYADLVALCQFLPGPASSQVGISHRDHAGGAARRAGGLDRLHAAVGAGAAALRLRRRCSSGNGDAGWLHGLKIVAVAVVAQAVWGMARTLCPDRPRIDAGRPGGGARRAGRRSAAVALGQIVVIVAGGGWSAGGCCRRRRRRRAPRRDAGASRSGTGWRSRPGRCCSGCWSAAAAAPGRAPARPWRCSTASTGSGSLVFGGGHVVLPLLQAEVVPPGWVTNEQFLAGYGAAQAVPGPLFTFSAYLGAVMPRRPARRAGGGARAGRRSSCRRSCWWSARCRAGSALRGRRGAQAALRGVNAAVVGLLLAALYQPVWTSAITSAADFGLALVRVRAADVLEGAAVAGGAAGSAGRRRAGPARVGHTGALRIRQQAQVATPSHRAARTGERPKRCRRCAWRLRRDLHRRGGQPSPPGQSAPGRSPAPAARTGGGARPATSGRA